jgi:hypothetical protein
MELNETEDGKKKQKGNSEEEMRCEYTVMTM